MGSKMCKGEMTLDLRPGIIRVKMTPEMSLNSLRDEAKKFITQEDQIVDVRRQEPKPEESGTNVDSTEPGEAKEAKANDAIALIEFKDRKSAEAFIVQRSKMP